jgi:hypothetical protein
MSNNWSLTELVVSQASKEDRINANVRSLINGVGATLSVVFPSDANYTPNDASTLAAFHLVVTSTGSLTATRNLVLPKIQKEWVVRNSTTGGQSIVAIGSTGTGVTITNGAYKRVLFDGTNFVDIS